MCSSVLPIQQFTCQIGLLWNRLAHVKNYWVGGLKLGYFSFVCLHPNLPISCQFRDFWAFQWPRTFFSSISGMEVKAVLKSNQYQPSASHGCQQSNYFPTQLGDFDYFMAHKHPNLGNWAYDYLIKIVLCYFQVIYRRHKSQFAVVWGSEVLEILALIRLW